MLRKIVCFVFVMTTGLAYVFSQAEKTNATVIKDSILFYNHEVVKGQTLYGLSKMYQVSMEDIILYNPTVQQGLKTGVHLYIPLTKQKVEIHTVKKGETLYTIARSKGIKENELLMLNPGMNETLSIGQEIIVPWVEIQLVEEEISATISASSTSTGNLSRKQRKAMEKEKEKKMMEEEQLIGNTFDSIFHIVEKGETLYGISKHYEITMDAIKNANPHIGETLNIGDRIYIPVTSDTIFIDDELGDENIDDDVSLISEGVKKETYTVYLLMPLYLSQVDVIEPAKVKSLNDYNKITPFSFIQFYEAMLLAADDISTKYPQIKINLYVEDITTSEQISDLISTGKLEDADMVIGPFQAQEFSTLCQYAKRKNILLINPFSTVETSDGMTYKATISDAYTGEYFAKYILEKHPNANIIFGNNQSSQENKLIATYRSAMQKVFNQAGKNINMQESNIKNGISSIKSVMSNKNENFLFVFFDGELMVTNFTQNLRASKIENLTLVVPEKWLKYDNIETEYFMDLNTHYVSQYFVDYSDPKVIRFIDAFRNAYDIEPTVEMHAFQGYDFTYYFLSKLCETGTSFRAFDNNENLLSTKFRFVPSTTHKNMMENTFIHIFKIQNFKYIDVFSDKGLDASKNSSKPMK
ncbi:MAG: LysM peptidoglycan-binding domain-containing protein [Bacteroidales bacterium]|jgi:LysM repeat protein/ABC-type branched-subunit amino acid transport system substrate-binding protein|nr:LysM peptidoglycan-binding domain-containing protein [Bacteroidales bacterium]